MTLGGYRRHGNVKEEAVATAALLVGRSLKGEKGGLYVARPGQILVFILS